ncbi:MAG: hypothetical protein KDI43_00980 [Gammaproteobacteria bacterium]|nr:hypothetical protein [Gammaproteobacteria bacterium]
MRAQMAVPLTVVLSLGLSVGCDGTPKPVSYGADIKPLIDRYCMECHAKEGEGAKASGFVVDSYDSVMKGTKYGPVIVPGDSLSSSLYLLVAGKVHSSIWMPHGRKPLEEREVATIERWISEGAGNN